MKFLILNPQFSILNSQFCNCLIHKLLVCVALHSAVFAAWRVVANYRYTCYIALLNGLECQFVASLYRLHHLIALFAVKGVLFALEEAFVACMIWLTATKDANTAKCDADEGCGTTYQHKCRFEIVGIIAILYKIVHYKQSYAR